MCAFKGHFTGIGERANQGQHVFSLAGGQCCIGLEGDFACGNGQVDPPGGTAHGLESSAVVADLAAVDPAVELDRRSCLGTDDPATVQNFATRADVEMVLNDQRPTIRRF